MIFGTGLYLLLVFLRQFIEAKLDPYDDNICLKTEIHNVTVLVDIYITKTKIETQWCMDASKFFRCQHKKTWKEPKKVPKVIQRNIVVPKCCFGYIEVPIKGSSDSKCVPECKNRCVNGQCVSPNTCDCDSGFYGQTCEEDCPTGFWGRNCYEHCDCLNEGDCDSVNGYCNCKPGWQGYRCELPCREGYYGNHCEDRCLCYGLPCDHQTGECLRIVTESTTEETNLLDNIDTINITAKNASKFDSPSEIPSTEVFSTKETTVEDNLESTTIANEYTTNINEEFISTTETHTKTSLSMIKTTMETTSKIESYSLESITKAEIVTSYKNDLDITEDNNKNMNEILITTDLSEAETYSTTNPSTTEKEIKITEAEILVVINKSDLMNEKPQTKSDDFNEKKDISENSTDSINADNRNIENSSVKDFAFRFIPSLTVLSGVSILIVIIGGRWLILNHRKKMKKIADEKEDRIFYSEENRKFFRDSVFTLHNVTDNPAYLSEIEQYKTVPVLQTFKPID